MIHTWANSNDSNDIKHQGKNLLQHLHVSQKLLTPLKQYVPVSSPHSWDELANLGTLGFKGARCVVSCRLEHRKRAGAVGEVQVQRPCQETRKDADQLL